MGVDAASDSETTYKTMLSKLPSGQDALCSAYEAIEKTVHDVDAYVRVSYVFCDFAGCFEVMIFVHLWS